jgi:hypothetical protein
MKEPYCLVIDTWEGQLEIDEAILLANNVAGMFIRLNDISGGHHKDKGFDKQWNEAKAFCRAPYFVYNPWVPGSSNFLWLQSNMPADAKAVAIDIEVRMPDYSPAMYAQEVKKFIDLCRGKWNFAIYTGEWFLSYLSTWPTDVMYWWAQYPYEFFPPDNLFWTWDELRNHLVKYTGPANIGKVPGGHLWGWQFTGDRIILPGNIREMDVSIFFGSRQELEAFMGAPAIQPPADIITDGYQKIRRNNSDVHIWRGKPTSLKVTDNSGLLIQPSDFAGTRAKVIINGDGWDKSLAITYHKPLSLAYSDGNLVQGAQYDMRPFFNSSKSNFISVDHRLDFNIPYNLVSGTRYLVQAGENFFENDTDPEHVTELNPRTAIGYTLDGKIITCVVDGRSTVSAGVTLRDLASILIEANAWYALELDGGDSSILLIDGIQKSHNGDLINGVRTERATVNSILIFQEGTTMSETFDYFAYTSSEPKHAIRVGPDVTQAYISNPNPIWFGGTPAKGKATVADVFTLPQDLIYNGAVVGLKGDIWRKVYDNNGHAVDGWIADVHMGKSTLSKVFIPAPSPTTKTIKLLTIEPAPGTVFTWLYSDGTNKKETV